MAEKYKLPTLSALNDSDLTFVAKIVNTFSADDVSHVVMHGAPEECERCEALAKRMPEFEGFLMDMTHPIWTEVVKLVYELETDSEYKTTRDRKGNWEKLLKERKITVEKIEFDWYLHGGKGHEFLDTLKDQGLSHSKAKELIDNRFDYEVTLRYNDDGKLIGAEGYYLSDKKYQPN